MSYSEVEEIYCRSEEERYNYFFSKVTESEQICGLKDNNEWVTIKDKKGNIAMPIWPSFEFAVYCKENQWKEAHPESIDLFEFLEYWLQGMKRDSCRVLVLGDSEGRGISVDAMELKDELEKYLSEKML